MKVGVDYLAQDSASRIERYWVGDFEDAMMEVGSRALHWEVEDNDGAGSLLDGLVGVTSDGFPTLISGKEFLFIDKADACNCCKGTGLTPGGKLRMRHPS